MTEKTVNYDCDKILVIHNPEGAGGKVFLSCLTLSNHVSPLNKELAEALLRGETIAEQSYKSVITTFYNKVKLNKHIEDGGTDFRGFDDETPYKQPSDTWIQLTHQNKIYGYLGNHSSSKNGFHMYKNAKHLVLKSISEILSDRGADPEAKSYDKVEHHSVHMNTVKDRELWYKQVTDACDYLNIPYPNEKMINAIRKGWLKTFKIGF